jgi:FixJ family two-component response regulator
LEAELLVKRVHSALRISEERRQAQQHHETVATRLARLSSREREVLDGLVNAMNTKQIAALLNVSPKTIDNHRASILKKFDLGSTLELVRMVLADGELKVVAR